MRITTLLLALTAILFAGCSRTSALPAPVTEAAPVTEPATSTVAPTESGHLPVGKPSQEGTAGSTSSASGTPASPPPAPVGTRRAAKDGITFDFDLFPLQRQGKAVELTGRLTVREVPPGGAELTAGDQLFTTVSKIDDPNHGRANGFRLVDTAGAVVHLPARIDGIDACSVEKTPQWHVGDVLWVSCLFAAPPETVRTVMVQTQTFGSFNDVPVQ
ncbi:hypothetical protein ACTQ49_07995 [Luteococcus sp. Sow4_B9]|uniref:hypothetical protein n=1 Tax=Luteococcus sp. Sow4_B9 TaxID=3438792 RepID=UPI003F9907D5